jgi:hypothetical protein
MKQIQNTKSVGDTLVDTLETWDKKIGDFQTALKYGQGKANDANSARSILISCL